MSQATIPAGEFKTHCLKLLDQVAATGQALTVTKHGRAVARLVPLPPEHSLFGAMAGDARLGAIARQAIDHAAAERALWVCAITPWEIAMLVAKQRLTLDRDVMDWIGTALAKPGIRLASLEPAICVASTRLPEALHADPADRLMVATARHLGAALVTADAALLAYAGKGHLAALTA